MIKRFIERPVFSTVISIIIVLLGILGITSLPITTYPDIAPPTIQITAQYPGANAETVLRSVIIPIEEQVNGVEGMTYITSSASNSGYASINVFFKQDIDSDIAAVNVQNRVARATPLLPSEVTKIGVVTQKQQTDALMFLSFHTDSKDYDDTYIQNYLNINVIPEIKRIQGVGDAKVFGAKNYAMRIWLEPTKLASYSLEPQDVLAAIRTQSLEAAAGTLGQNSGSSFEYVIKYKGKLRDTKEYEDIIIKSLGQGQYLRLKDVAKVELDAFSYSVASELNGNPSIAIGIMQTPGSNAQEIIEHIKTYLTDLESKLPEGIHFTVLYDTNEFLEGSIESVLRTLLEAFLLVFLVVYIFLQDIRSTLIPAIAVPVSIIGTFFFLNLLGYSINLLTLFALVLAIGIVVDDAIVVVEAVHAKLEHRKTTVKNATINAMHEIAGAIVSITIVMAAVFIPVTFIKGPTGVFYEQFGITLAIAIFISAINALTLSPALCAIFLKANHYDKKYEDKSFLDKFFHKFNIAFNAITKRYAATFTFFIRHRWITVVLFLGAVGALFFVSNEIPSGFVPQEDKGLIMFNTELPAGASLDRTAALLREFQAKAKHVEGIQDISTIAGYSLLNGSGSNYAFGFIKLKNFDERDSEETSIATITKKMFGIGATMSDARMIFFAPPSIPGYGTSAGFQFSLTDRTGGDLKKLDKVAKQFMYALYQRPEVKYAQTAFDTNFPQYEMNIDVARAMDAGIPVSKIAAVMQGYIGGMYAADFSKYGKQYRVMLQASPDQRTKEQDLSQMFIRTASGNMAPVSQFIRLDRIYGPQTINRFNLFQAANFTGAMNPGYSTGDAIKAINEMSAKMLPQNYEVSYSGLTREEIKAGKQAIIIFILSLIFVYFILSAQYESYILPLSVLLSLPFGVFGAFLGQWLFGLENNIYFQIALIMLIGLLAKNAILIVEFGVQRRQHGESIPRAAINAAKARLRPILMTSFAFIFGMLPLVFSSGMGATGNRSIGTGAASGLLIGTAFGIIVIPVLFVIFQTIQERIKPLHIDKAEVLQ